MAASRQTTLNFVGQGFVPALGFTCCTNAPLALKPQILQAMPSLPRAPTSVLQGIYTVNTHHHAIVLNGDNITHMHVILHVS